jgi:hypothetical protein
MAHMAAVPGPGPALLGYALEELGAAVDALDAFDGRLHAGVHRARKAMRRTRATLALGANALGPGARLIDRRLRKVNRGLSVLRDASALVETLDRLLERAGDDALKSRLASARACADERRRTMAKDPACLRDVADVRAILATLRAALHGLSWHALPPDTIDTALARSARRIDKARKRVDRTDDDADWHAWRRRLRRLSQQHRALAAAGAPSDDSGFDQSLTEQLGALQDLQLLLDHCDRDSPFGDRDRRALADYARDALQRQRRRLRSAGIEHAARNQAD